jgi:hypothetical protein
MLNDSCFGFSSGVSVDWLSSRFIAFGLPAGQDEKRTVRLSRPVLLYSRSTALELLLSIALREAFVERSRVYHPLFVQDKNGLLFVYKVVPFSLIILMSVFSKWALFRL